MTNDRLEKTDTYEITLQIPMTLSQRLDYGSPSQWDWMTLVDLTEKVTVKNCDLIESYVKIKETDESVK